VSRTKTDLDSEFRTTSLTLRGTTYTFRELSGEQYEEFIKMAAGPDGDADLSVVLKLMAPEALISPKLTAKEIYAKPMPVFNAIIGQVNTMHFRSEPEDKPAADAAEPETPGNGSEPPIS